MSDTVKRYDVVIGDQTYSLMSDRSVVYINSAAQLVETSLEQLKVKAPNIDAKRMAVMVALQLACKLIDVETAQDSCDDHATHLTQLIERALLPL